MQNCQFWEFLAWKTTVYFGLFGTFKNPIGYLNLVQCITMGLWVSNSHRFLFCTRLASLEEDSSKSPTQLDVEDRWNPYRWSCNGQPQRRWSDHVYALHRTFHSHRMSRSSFLCQNWKNIRNALPHNMSTHNSKSELAPDRRVTPHLCFPRKPVSFSEHIHG